MKQLFYTLVMIAIVTTAYLKAMSLQDDAARELAQVLNEQKKEKPQEMNRSFEALAQQMVTQEHMSTTTTTVVTTTVPHTSESVGGEEPSENVKEAEGQIAELQLDPELETVFAGKQPVLLYSAIRRIILLQQNPGYVRYEDELYNRDLEFLQEHELTAIQAVTEIITGLPPAQQGALPPLERVKNYLQGKLNTIENERRQDLQEMHE